MPPHTCSCGSGEEPYELCDIKGIFISYVCKHCEAEVKKGYRPEMFTGYSQDDVDEPIEPEDDSFEGPGGPVMDQLEQQEQDFWARKSDEIDNIQREQ
jgi:hypothetical protein